MRGGGGGTGGHDGAGWCRREGRGVLGTRYVSGERSLWWVTF